MGIGQADKEDGLAEVGVYGELTVGTSPVLVKVGASALAGRTYVGIRPKANSVYFGFDNSVTTTTGMRIFKDELVILPVSDVLTLYLVANGAGRAVSIFELGNDAEV